MMIRAFFFFLVVCVFPFSASAQVVYDAHTEAELIGEVSTIKPGEPFWVGLRLKTDPHWHTYWRNPGDSGLATTIRWDLPEGFQASEIFWPYPQRIDASGLTGYGYEDEMVLLTRITPPSAISQNVVEIKARADWLACEVPCIPGRGEFVLPLNVAEQAAMNGQTEKFFQENRLRLAFSDASWSFRIFDDADYYQFDARMDKPDPRIVGMSFFPYRDDVIVHSAQQDFEQIDDGHFRLTLVKNQRGSDAEISVLEGVLVAYGKDAQPLTAVEAKAYPVQKEPAPLMKSAGASPPSDGLMTMLAFAFLGGIILNLMPCVFPVLSIKVLSFVRHAQNRRALTLSAAGYALGIVASFVMLALALIILRKGGESVGWGFQFQSPEFVVGMIFLLLLIALNLFGLFEIRIPGWSVAGSPDRSGFMEALAAGCLAVVVATPCTAPFMGAAMSFALTQAAWVNILIFVCLGLGLATPFAILCACPAALKFLPKPGAWMERFKIFLAFPLLATIVWLLWVLEAQKGFAAVILILGSLLLISLGVWLLSVLRSVGWRLVSWILLLAALTGPFFRLPAFSPPQTAVSDENIWQDYDARAVAGFEQQGRSIFYDFTARWCLTCQVNKKAVLNQPDVLKAFADKGVILVRADWTNRDSAITEKLHQLGKNSVPVYVLSHVTDGRRTKKILPELLTQTVVLEALEAVGTQP